MRRIIFTSLYKSFKFKKQRKTSAWIEKIIASHHKLPGAISFIFCTDRYLLSINEKYLHHHTLTDIITFNYNQGLYISGDIFISIQRVRENAEKFNTLFEDELNRVMIHGVLHLLGFNDKSPAQKKKMFEQEQKSLSMLYA